MMMKKILLLLLLATGSIPALFAQDDLLNMMEKETPKVKTPVNATFKSTRVINLQSNENMKAKHMDFRIQHRFGPVKNGAYDFWGLDVATLRLSLEYGITDHLMVGVGRSTTGKTYDGFAKYQLVQQKTSGTPLSVNLFGSAAISTLEAPPGEEVLLKSRMAYCAQVIFARKFNDYISLLVSPTMVHYNLVENKETPNDIFAIGLGASVKLTRSTRFNIEYVPRLNGRDQPKTSAGEPTYYDAIAFGFDIETGGHVFQLHFTNSTGLIEQQFIARNTNKVTFQELRFGFNISRTFSFDRR
jgi:hypothetical protein